LVYFCVIFNKTKILNIKKTKLNKIKVNVPEHNLLSLKWLADRGRQPLPADLHFWRSGLQDSGKRSSAEERSGPCSVGPFWVEVAEIWRPEYRKPRIIGCELNLCY
jgi:hypothetical protein